MTEVGTGASRGEEEPRSAAAGQEEEEEEEGAGKESLFAVCVRLRQQVDLLLAEDFGGANGADVGGTAAAAGGGDAAGGEGGAATAGAPREVMARVQEQTRRSMAVIEEALRRYSLDSLSLSYNGGKDCLVLLVLFLACLPTSLPSSGKTTTAEAGAATTTSLPSSSNTTTTPTKTTTTTTTTPPTPPGFPALLPSIYIVSPHPFPAVESFVASSSAAYRLSLSRLADASLKAAFARHLSSHPSVRAVLVGTRRTDPHGASLGDFQHTDAGWPSFMRVNPLLEWRYAEIWAFIRFLGIEYCELYDQGYTSLGGTSDTKPNPALRVLGGGGRRFRPAHELPDGDFAERLGRAG